MPDETFMARAIQIAEKPLFSPHPNPRVGCVIVSNNQIVGEGFHEYAGGSHAEINALNQAGKMAAGATVYLSLEPCCFYGRTPPCVNALIQASVKKVFVSMLDPNPKVAGKGLGLLQQANIDVHVGILSEQARQINEGFIRRMTRGRPWVRCKMAMSFDGRTALKNGASQWISGVAARQDVQRYRAKSDVILTGLGTVLADNPRMTQREFAADSGLNNAENIDHRQPLRVIVDSQLRADPGLRIFQEPGKVMIATLAKKKIHYNENVAIHVFPANESGVDLISLLEFLANLEINEVQVEAGAKLNGALLKAGLVDELVVYMASVILGDSARGLFTLPELRNMEDKVKLNCLDLRKIGEDFRFIMRPEYSNE